MISPTAISCYAVYIMGGELRLQSLGWRPFFQSQLDVDTEQLPARVLSVHRGRVELAHEKGRKTVAITGKSAALDITVGDWVLIDPDGSEAPREPIVDAIAGADAARAQRRAPERRSGAAPVASGLHPA